jgi:hypothetical protein
MIKQVSGAAKRQGSTLHYYCTFPRLQSKMLMLQYMQQNLSAHSATAARATIVYPAQLLGDR